MITGNHDDADTSFPTAGDGFFGLRAWQIAESDVFEEDKFALERVRVEYVARGSRQNRPRRDSDDAEPFSSHSIGHLTSLFGIATAGKNVFWCAFDDEL